MKKIFIFSLISILLPIACKAMEHENQAALEKARTELAQDNYALHKACILGDIEKVQLFISIQADVTIKNHNGDTPLHCAVKNRHVTIVQLLIDSNADINAKNNDNWSALHMAAFHNYREILELLVKQKKIIKNLEGPNNQTPLRMAVIRGNIDAVKILFDPQKDQNCLEDAIYGGHTDIAEFIISSFDRDKKIEEGQNALYLASSLDKEDIVRLLINAGVDPNTKNEGGMTPLHYAVAFASLEAIKILLQANANCNAQTTEGHTVLHVWAKECKKGTFDFAEETSLQLLRLLSAFCNSTLVNNEGKTAYEVFLDYDKDRTEICSFLSGRGPLKGIRKMCLECRPKQIRPSIRQELIFRQIGIRKTNQLPQI